MSEQITELANEPTTRFEYVKMYYEHQYDRMAKQEEQRHSVTNVVVGLSILAFTFGFNSGETSNIALSIILPLAVAIANLIAVVYMHTTIKWINVHRRRAKRTLETYAPELYKLDQSFPIVFKGRIKLSRWRLQRLLHVILVILSAAAIVFILV